MKIVKYLIVIVLTLIWLLMLLVITPTAINPLIFQTILSLIYGSLVFLAWPLGTSYSALAFNRFYIVMGFGMFLLAGDVMLNSDCSAFPLLLTSTNPQPSDIKGVVSISCNYLGKVPTAILLFLWGCRLLYKGYTKKSFK